MSVSTGITLASPLQVGSGELVAGLGVAGAAVVWTAVSSFIALGMLLLFPDWTEGAVRTARASTLLSAGVGTAGLLALGGVVAVLLVITIVPFVGAIIAFVVSVPIFVFSIGSHAVSVVTFGTVISSALGRDSVWLGVFVGAVALTVLSYIPVLGAAVTLVVQVVGLGASLRVTFGSGASKQEERYIPSAHGL